MSQMTSTARAGARSLNRPALQAPRLRVVTGAPLRHGGAAFGVICAVLLAVGLAGLLLLNTSLAQGSFTLSRLQATSDQLTDVQGALKQSLAASEAPANLASRAVGMGMVPSQSAAFLRLSDGKVIGVAKPASPAYLPTVGVSPSSAVAPVAAKTLKKPSATAGVKPVKRAQVAAKAPRQAKR